MSYEKRVVFRTLYQQLTTHEAREQYIRDLGAEFQTLLHSGYLYRDERDGHLYDCMFVDNTRWFAQDFALDVEEERDMAGRYTFEAALEACPAGWRLPTTDDYYDLLYHVERLTEVNDWMDDPWETIEALMEDQRVDFNAEAVSYYDDAVCFWAANKGYLYLDEGQNERHIAIYDHFDSYSAPYQFVRYVQEWPF